MQNKKPGVVITKALRMAGGPPKEPPKPPGEPPRPPKPPGTPPPKV